MIDDAAWSNLRRLFTAAFASNLHVSIASVGSDGTPFVTPLGSLLLGAPGHAFYFEFYASALGRRIAANPRVSVLAVDAGRGLWLRALTSGRFARLPGARLFGEAARAGRASTEEERARIRRRLGIFRRLPGGRALWPGIDEDGSSGRIVVRDIHVERVEALGLGRLTVAL